MDNLAEMDFNITNGEFSRNDIKLVYNNVEYQVNGLFSNSFARKLEDGRFTTDLPKNTKVFVIARNAIPLEIPIENLRLVYVKVGSSEMYAVRYITGTDFYALTLKPIDSIEELSDGLSSGSSDNSDISNSKGTSNSPDRYKVVV